MKRFITIGFGLLLLSMAVCQITTFSYFNSVMHNYLTPMGDGVKPLALFVAPFAFGLIVLELGGMIGLLLVSNDNLYKSVLIKMGVAAMIIWLLLVLSMLLRNHPFNVAGYFGGRLRQSLGLLVLMQNIAFVVWGVAAYRLSEFND